MKLRYPLVIRRNHRDMRQFIHANKMNEWDNRKERVDCVPQFSTPCSFASTKAHQLQFPFQSDDAKTEAGQTLGCGSNFAYPYFIRSASCPMYKLCTISWCRVISYLFYHFSESKCSAPPCLLALSIKGSSQIILSLSLLFFNPYWSFYQMLL